MQIFGALAFAFFALWMVVWLGSWLKDLPPTSTVQPQETIPATPTGSPTSGDRQSRATTDSVDKDESIKESSLSSTYRARLSPRDHFTTAGRDLRTVHGIRANDILLQDRVNFHRKINQDMEDQDDLIQQNESVTALRSIFENRPVQVTPPGEEKAIIFGNPLVKVTVFPKRIDVWIIDSKTPTP